MGTEIRENDLQLYLLNPLFQINLLKIFFSEFEYFKQPKKNSFSGCKFHI